MTIYNFILVIAVDKTDLIKQGVNYDIQYRS